MKQQKRYPQSRMDQQVGELLRDSDPDHYIAIRDYIEEYRPSRAGWLADGSAPRRTK